MDHWHVLHDVEFDFSWHPHPFDPPYIYVFGNQWWPGERMPTVEYRVPGATERKFLSTPALVKPTTNNWQILEKIAGFDFSWCPDPGDPPYIYVFGNQHYSGTIMPTVVYTVPGATQKKFLDFPLAKLSPSRDNWELLEDIDELQWDWTWRPNPLEPAYIYEFGNQWNPPEHKVSIRYRVVGATETKFIGDVKTVRLPQPNLFRHNIAVNSFDYSWEPNPFDPPMTYVFGNQWNPGVLEPTVVYTVPDATEIKYVDDLIAIVAADITHWELLDDIKSFDYSWRPNPTDPAYIYVFGNQWSSPEQRPALQYLVPGATEIKYISEPRALRIGEPEKFITHYDCEFDFSWEPDPGSPAYNYIFGNQWYSAEIMPTVEYRMPGATESKYIDNPRACLLERHDNQWHTLIDCEWDYSWRPEPGSPQLIFVFGNQHWPAIKMPTVEYRMPGATERKYMEYPVAKLLVDETNWAIPEEVNRNNVDFSWVPDPNETPFIHHFGTEYQQSIGLTYTVPGATEIKFAGEPPKIVQEHRIIDILDIFFVDKNNATAQARYERLQTKYPKIQKIRYANSMLDTIKRCTSRTKNNKFWVISSEYNYDTFDFAWHAQPWQNYMTHVFPSQHQKWSDSFLINKWEFERNIQWARRLEEFPNLNFVSNQIVDKPDNLHNIYYVDHGNGTIAKHQYEVLREHHPDMVMTRFVGNYLDTFKRIMATAETEYVWIINSICDYTQFDFTWQPEPWQKEMIHVFQSDHTKQGDTFYIHVESFRQQMCELDILDFFNVINYIPEPRVPRFDCPVHLYQGDDLVAEIQNYKFESPYVFFSKDHTRYDSKSRRIVPNFCLWSEKDRTVVRYNGSGSSALVPRDIKTHLKTQVYDYPYINKLHSGTTDQHLDIIYISNGEPDEQRWFDHTEYMSNRTVKWSRGVNGRTAAYQAAARLSDTPWFFMVFAKLEVLGGNFDWHWQPDYFQGPKHYIFNAKNPVNGLEYGHMGMIAFNKNLVLSNNNPGIDFTLSQPHESVPTLSGIAHFNQDAWMTWRTAFREVLKLKHFITIAPTLETEHRLNTWLTVAQGDYAKHCLAGARDAVEYYDEVAGDYELLKLSFDWAWLQERFNVSNSAQH